MQDRPAGGEVVGGRAGGRGDDDAVGAEGRDEEPVHRDVHLDDARGAGLGDDHVVEDVGRDVGAALPVDDRAQEPPLLVLVAPLDDPLEGGVELGEGDLGEEAEAAEVHPEDRDGLVEEAARREEGAVAAEHDERVGEAGHLPARGDAGTRAASDPPAEGGGRVVEADPDAPPAEPLDELAEGGPRVLEVGPGQDADRAHADTAFPRTASSASGASVVPARREVQEELAVALGPRHRGRARPAHRVAEALRLAGHVPEGLEVQRRVLHDAAAAHLEAAHLELGLDEHHRLRARGRAPRGARAGSSARR